MADFVGRTSTVLASSFLTGGAFGGGGPTDTTPPTIGSISPAPGAISRTQQIQFTIADAVALGTVVVLASYATSTRFETVYSGSAFASAYTALSSVVVDATSAAFTIRRDNPGWLDSPTLVIVAHDVAGNLLNPTLAYTVAGYPFAPSLGAGVLSGSGRAQQVSIPITDDRGVHRVIASVTYASAPDAEIVYDGAAFSTAYDTGSSLSGTASSTSRTLVVARDAPGWLDAATVHVSVIDVDGNVTSANYAISVTGYPFPPTISLVSPAPGALGQVQSVSFRVLGGVITKIVIWVEFDALSDSEIVYNGTSFIDHYALMSTITPVTGGYDFVLTRFSGWAASPTVWILVADEDGNTESAQLAYTVPGVVAPQIAFDPLPGIVAQDAAITVTITDNNNQIAFAAVYALYPSGSWEVVWDGTMFAPYFSGLSSRTPTIDGFEYVVARHGGWPEPPKLRVVALDVDGQSGVLA